MIDRASRDRLAQALRQLASGAITSYEFDDNAFEESLDVKEDPAVPELATYGWLHYSDFSNYRLRGRKALSKEVRRSIARCALFLKTDQEYVHGDSLESGTCLGKGPARYLLLTIAFAVVAGALSKWAFGTFLLGLCGIFVIAYLSYLSFVLILQLIRRPSTYPILDGTFWPYLDERASMDKYFYWPFENKDVYQSALSNPPYLCDK